MAEEEQLKLKNEVNRICEGLADKGEESIFVTVSLEKTTVFVMGSDIGLQWLDTQTEFVQKFFKFCSAVTNQSVCGEQSKLDCALKKNVSKASSDSDTVDKSIGKVTLDLSLPATPKPQQETVTNNLSCKNTVGKSDKMSTKKSDVDLLTISDDERKTRKRKLLPVEKERSIVTKQKKVADLNSEKVIIGQESKIQPQHMPVPEGPRHMPVPERPRRMPVPKKHHQMECFVKLENLRIEPYQHEQLLRDTVSEVNLVNRSEESVCNGTELDNSMADQEIKEVEDHVKVRNHSEKDNPILCSFCPTQITSDIENSNHSERNSPKISPKQFSSITDLHDHCKQVHQKKTFLCTVCDLLFLTEYEYNKHSNQHEEVLKLFKCIKCGKAFELLEYLKRHNRTIHNAVGERICKFCLDWFDNEEEYNEHLKTHASDKPNTCMFCRKSFSTKDLLDTHIKLVHQGGVSYICEICGFEAENSLKINHHRLEHEEKMPYHCDICGKGFIYKIKFDNHMIIHQESLPFVCETCGKRFKRATTLRGHKKVHSEGMKCKYCNKVFKSYGGMTYHTVNSHPEEVNVENLNKVMYSCKFCNVKFNSRSLLKQHEIKHQTERNYVCSTCPKRFKTEQQKIKHEDCHLEYKAFSCAPCGIGFSTKARWEAHLKTAKHEMNINPDGGVKAKRGSKNAGTKQSAGTTTTIYVIGDCNGLDFGNVDDSNPVPVELIQTIQSIQSEGVEIAQA